MKTINFLISILLWSVVRAEFNHGRNSTSSTFIDKLPRGETSTTDVLPTGETSTTYVLRGEISTTDVLPMREIRTTDVLPMVEISTPDVLPMGKISTTDVLPMGKVSTTDVLPMGEISTTYVLRERLETSLENKRAKWKRDILETTSTLTAENSDSYTIIYSSTPKFVPEVLSESIVETLSVSTPVTSTEIVSPESSIASSTEIIESTLSSLSKSFSSTPSFSSTISAEIPSVSYESSIISSSMSASESLMPNQNTTIISSSEATMIYNSTIQLSSTEVASSTFIINHTNMSSSVIESMSISPSFISNSTEVISSASMESVHSNVSSSSMVNYSNVSSKSIPSMVVSPSFTLNYTNVSLSTMASTPISPSFILNSTNVTQAIIVQTALTPSFVLNSTNVSSPVISPTSPIFILNSTNVASSIASFSFWCPTVTVYVKCTSAPVIDTFTPYINFTANMTVSPSMNYTSYINFTATMSVSPSANQSVVNVTSTQLFTSITNRTSHLTSAFSTVLTSSFTPPNSSSTHYITTVANVTTYLSTVPPLTTTYVNHNSSMLTQVSTFLSNPTISVFNLSTAIQPVYSSAAVIQPAIDKCDRYLIALTSAITNLTSCMLHHMHPMRVCSICCVQYNTFQKYHKIFKDCGHVLITDYNEKYQLIPKIFASQDYAWNSLECYKCYDSTGTGYSKKFVEFMHLYDEVSECFKNNTQVSIIQVGNQTLVNKTYGELCTNCFQLYKKLQRKFQFSNDDLKTASTSWCADINVAVNNTRHLWSNTFSCSRPNQDLETVIALTVFFCFLPIVFYVGAKLHTDVKERKMANRFTYESE